MQTVRVYKDNLREHILRSLFFTDIVLFLGVGGILAAGTFLCCFFMLHIKQPGVIISSIFLVELFYAIIATMKIEQQPIYTLIPRTILFFLSPKKQPFQQIRKTTGDFRIVGRYVIRHKKLLTIYEIYPTDIALLNDEQLERFYQHMKTMLHTLPGNIQIIAKKQRAQVEEYNNHFFSLFETANHKVNWLIENYTKELSDLIHTNSFQIMKYYLILSTPFPSNSDENMSVSAQKVADTAKRIGSSLALENMHIVQLTHEQLVEYFCKTFQPL